MNLRERAWASLKRRLGNFVNRGYAISDAPEVSQAALVEVRSIRSGESRNILFPFGKSKNVRKNTAAKALITPNLVSCKILIGKRIFGGCDC